MYLMKYLLCGVCLSGVGIYSQFVSPKESTDLLTPVEPSTRNLLALDDEALQRLAGPRKPQRIEAHQSMALSVPSGAADTAEVEAAKIEDILRSASGVKISDADVLRPRRVTWTISEVRYEKIPPEELAAAKKLSDSIEALRRADNETTRAQATEAIEALLTDQFERDIQQREKELSDIESRVKNLRAQLDARKAARHRIIGLRLQTVINDADGLGFPVGHRPLIEQFHSGTPVIELYQTQ